MTGRTLLRLSALLIVSLAPGCDNVEWGGFNLHLQEPPARDALPAPGTGPSQPAAPPGLSERTFLYLVERDAAALRLVPAGEIVGDSLAHFPSEAEAPGFLERFTAELLPEGAHFVLFAEGERVGNFTVQSVDTDASFCVPRPAARGFVELLPEAAGVTRFLALPADLAHGRARGSFTIPSLDAAQRDATLSLPTQVLIGLGATVPPNILNSRFAMRAFQPDGSPPLFAATYLFRDRLMIERPPPTAYSLFLLGAPAGDGHESAFTWYREVSHEGKGAPRFFEHLDWSGDGRPGVLLEVLGERHRWVAALTQRDGRWTRVFEEPCGVAAPRPGGAAEGGTS